MLNVTTATEKDICLKTVERHQLEIIEPIIMVLSPEVL
jgi:hypothetical protein